MRRIFGAALALLGGCAPAEDAMVSTLGTWSDIDPYMERLVGAPEYGVLIITVEQTQAFVQFSSSPGEVQIDFPLITQDQQVREESIREFFRSRGLTVVENRGSDGARFLDVHLEADPQHLSEITKDVLVQILGADEGADLMFTSQGI